jgi:hypothetical protein
MTTAKIPITVVVVVALEALVGQAKIAIKKWQLTAVRVPQAIY